MLDFSLKHLNYLTTFCARICFRVPIHRFCLWPSKAPRDSHINKPLGQKTQQNFAFVGGG
jgi:hypothetical protein